VKKIELWRELDIEGKIEGQFTYDFDNEVECEEFYWKHLYEGGSPFSWYIKMDDDKKYLSKGNKIINKFDY
jgi:hypothetical protein